MPSLAKPPRHFIVAGTAVLFLVICTTFYLYDGSSSLPFQPAPPEVETPAPPGEVPVIIDSEGRPIPTDCPAEFQYLARAKAEAGLTDRIHYSRRCIRPIVKDDVDRNKIVDFAEPLVKNSTEVDIFDCWAATLPEPDCEPLELEVSPGYPLEDFSHLAFGVATDAERLEASRTTFMHWMSGSKAPLVVALTDWHWQTWEDIAAIEQLFADVDINCTIVEPLDREFSISQNHFAVLGDMTRVTNETAEWYVLIDDDTFYPNLKPLSDALRTLDHRKDYYVGTLSEDFGAVRNFGYMAFGGAGAYLSASLGKKLGDARERCIAEATLDFGDIIIRDCVYTNSKAKLTQLLGLYQQDMKTDASGFFESGVNPINFHHWKSWYHEPVVKMSRTAGYCGDCFLQRWRFGDDTVFTNGYSIAVYPQGHQSIDLRLMEGTWDWASREYDFSVGPLRDRVPPGQKESWRLIDSEVHGNVFKQLYARQGDTLRGEIDSVIELIWDKSK